MYCVLLPTSTTPPSLPCAPPYLSPMEMHWGQGIWGEEHREAALRNLKGILMNQHSRTDYSHDNRPQTNSCIWSPLVLWLWKYCVCVLLFLFSKYIMCLLSMCVCTHMCTSVYLYIFLRNWPGNWFTLMSTEEVIIVRGPETAFFIFNIKVMLVCPPPPKKLVLRRDAKSVSHIWEDN